MINYQFCCAVADYLQAFFASELVQRNVQMNDGDATHPDELHCSLLVIAISVTLAAPLALRQSQCSPLVRAWLEAQSIPDAPRLIN